MSATTLSYGLRQQELWKTGRVKSLLTEQTINHPLGMPCYYAVLYYGKSFTGEFLDSEDYRKRWDRSEVKKTHRFVSNRLRRCFGQDIPLWWFINRHDSYEDAEGTQKAGSFHSDLYIGHIPDEAIEDPSPALMPLFYKEDEAGVPINCRPVGIEVMKMLLLDVCIREAKWVGKHPNALKVQQVPPEEFEQTFDYGLKDLTTIDDLSLVIDWDNSSFYTPTKPKPNEVKKHLSFT